MSHRKSDLGIPCSRKICQSSASRPPSPAIDALSVELFKIGIELVGEGHGDSDAFREISLALHRRLGLKPWHPHVLSMTIDDPPPSGEPHHINYWAVVKKLRYQLIALT
jgi:hypothetical protein